MAWAGLNLGKKVDPKFVFIESQNEVVLADAEFAVDGAHKSIKWREGGTDAAISVVVTASNEARPPPPDPAVRAFLAKALR